MRLAHLVSISHCAWGPTPTRFTLATLAGLATTNQPRGNFEHLAGMLRRASPSPALYARDTRAANGE